MGNVNDPGAYDKLNNMCLSTPSPPQPHSLRIGISNMKYVSIISKNPHIILGILNYLKLLGNGISNTSYSNQGVAHVFNCNVSISQDIAATGIVDYVMSNSSYKWLCEGKGTGKGYSQIRLSFISPNANQNNDDSKEAPKVVIVQKPNVDKNVNVSPAYNEEGDLPPGWSKGVANDGRVYYKNDLNKTTQWHHPSKNNETYQ
eukprot:46485_1